MKFSKDKIYIFSKDKFIKHSDNNKVSYENDIVVASWVDRCDGQEVEQITDYYGLIGTMYILPVWCKIPRKINNKKGC